jgi:hypothetical protein
MGWELSWLPSAYPNEFRDSTLLEYDSPILNTYTLNFANLMTLSFVAFEEQNNRMTSV